jgi:PAS domain S-box-containing protein
VWNIPRFVAGSVAINLVHPPKSGYHGSHEVPPYRGRGQLTPTITMTLTALPIINSDAFFQTVFNATLECLWVLTPTGMVHSANRTALEMVEVPESDIIGKPFWETPWWSESGATRTTVRDAVTKSYQGATCDELQIRNQNDTLIWIDLLLKPVFQETGELHFLIAEGRDVSERKKALERLQERELLLAEAQALGKLGSWTWEAATNEITWTEGLYRVFGFEDDSQPRTAEDYGPRVHPDDRDAMSTSLQGIMETDSPIHYSHRVVRPNGEIRHVHGVARRETDSQAKVARVFGMIQDITTQHLTEERLARSFERLEMVSRLAQSFTTTLDKSSIFGQVVKALRPLIDADTVVIFEPDGNELAIRAADRGSAGEMVGVRVPISQTIAGDVWQSGKSTLIKGDEFKYPVLPHLLEPLGYLPQAIIAVPICWQDERMGVLEAFHKEESVFTEDDRQLLEIVAVWLAIALINVRLMEAQKVARRMAEQQSERLQVLTRRILSAQEDERRRMAQELHDEAGQALAVLKMNLSLLRKDIQDPALQARLSEILDLTGQTAKNVRLLAHNLRPPSLDAFGLIHTLEELCRKFAMHTQLQLDFHAAPLPTLSKDFNIVCYRFVQEALANIAKHANATHITITIKIIETTLEIEVRDNGQGFDIKRAQLGIGFLGMTERLELLEGTLTVESQVGVGTYLVARVPLTGIEVPEQS